MYIWQCFLFVVSWTLVNTQDDASTVVVIADTTTPVSDPNDQVICSTCACVDGRVDCTDRDIRSFYQFDEWEALKALNPISLDLSGNPLTSLSQFPELPIQNLTVSGCELEVLEFGFIRLLTEHLVRLDLSDNEITTNALNKRIFVGVLLPNKDPKKFSKLRYLSLAKNDIHSVPLDLFGFMQDLNQLDLSENPLAYLDQVTMAALSELTKLKVLSLSTCDLETIPEGFFRGLRRLDTLDLSGNRFTMVPLTLGEAVNLVNLNLDRNPIESIDNTKTFSSLTKLKELHMCRLSKLKRIGANALGGLQSLLVLHLCHNPRLTYIDDEFLAWVDNDEAERKPLMREVYLNNNNISEISPYFLDRWDLLVAMDFANNPFQCACAQWMVDVLVPLIQSWPESKESAAHMTCTGPKELRGLTFAQLHNSSKILPCVKTQNSTQQTDTAMMLGIMIGVFVTFPLVMLVVLLWKRGIFSKCRKHRSVREYEEDMYPF